MDNSENQMNHPVFKAKIYMPFKGIDWRINSFRLNLEYEEIQELKKAKIKYLEEQESKFSS